LFWLPKGQRQLKETGFLFEIGFDPLSLAPEQNGAILVLILDMIGSWRPLSTFELGSKGQFPGELDSPKRF
jgi:hypothetical protein